MLALVFIHSLVDFHWSLSDSKSSNVRMALLYILWDFNNAVVWMVSIGSEISNFSHPLFQDFVRPYQVRQKHLVLPLRY